MDNILIIGSSGHSRVIIDIIEKEGKYKIIGYIDKNYEENQYIFNYPVLGSDDDIPKIINEYSIYGAIIAIANNKIRYNLKNKIKKISPNLNFISAIHPHSVIGRNVKIGEGSAIMAGAIINSNTKIGKFCIINTKASLDHDSIMYNFSSLGPNVTTGGSCSIGKMSFVGIGAVISDNIKIGQNSIIGANSTVLKNIGDLKVAYGSPSKIIRDL